MGGFNYEKMSNPSKLAMKMFIKALKAKKGKIEEYEEKIVYGNLPQQDRFLAKLSEPQTFLLKLRSSFVCIYHTWKM